MYISQEDLRKLLEDCWRAADLFYSEPENYTDMETHITSQLSALQEKGEGVVLDDLKLLQLAAENIDDSNLSIRERAFAKEYWVDGYRYAATLPPAGQPTGMNGWVELKEGNPLPDYDEPALWLSDDGCVHVDSLDKDGNPEIFEGYLLLGVGPLIKTTHWMKMPPLPDEKPPTND